MNDIDINTFVKDTHSTNNTRASLHIILISNNVTQVLKSMFFELKDRELCNMFPDEVALCCINSEQLSTRRSNMADKDYMRRSSGIIRRLGIFDRSVNIYIIHSYQVPKVFHKVCDFIKCSLSINPEGIAHEVEKYHWIIHRCC